MGPLELKLDSAIARDDFDAVVDLIDKGANAFYRDPMGWTCLMNAGWIGSPRLFKYLLGLGVDPDAVNVDGETIKIMLDGLDQKAVGHIEVLKIIDSLNMKN